jgi:hypothetical protein
MDGLLPFSAAWLLLLIPAVGVLSALSARRGIGTLRQAARHRVFWGFFLLAGIASIAATLFQHGCCLACGTLVTVMALTATYDHGQTVRRHDLMR